MMFMGDNLKKVAGSKLELILYKLSSTPIKGILLGTGVTAIIQSSSATSVMVVGFVNSGMMKVRQAIGVVMGAIIGTSVTGWIICLSSLGTGAGGVLRLFSTETLSAVVAVIGTVLVMASKRESRRHIGQILLGFAVLMYGMQLMSDSVSVLRENEQFIRMITSFSNPLLGILAGILFTSVLQSASAAVGIVQALSVTGAINFGVALPLIMGIAIGAAVPVLLSALGSGTAGKRTALSYLAIDVLGAAIIGIVFYALHAAIGFAFMDHVMSSMNIALLNTMFRLVIVIVLAPFISVLEKLCQAVIKDDRQSAELHDIDRLEERFLAHPAIAVEQSCQTVNAMAQRTQTNISDALALLRHYSPDGFAAVENTEQLIDSYEDKLGAYLVKITGRELDQTQYKAVSMCLHAITDLERMSDHALNIAENAREKHEKKISFSVEAERELGVLTCAVSEIMALAVAALADNDAAPAYRIEPLEEHIDHLCDAMKLRHIQRIEDGACTLAHGFVFNDLLTNLERVADHCSNIGVAVIEFENHAVGAHEYLGGLRAEHTEQFNQYYAEYAARFSI
ncbi:MAG: Na/Pi cotransporter family protein [Clostridiales bacterium]|nr:Na/Pi cotransporter family protein [Candidatus Cacconaster stercorequi]